jgi:hypothetical protein
MATKPTHRIRRAIALVTSTMLAAGALAVTTPIAASAAPLSIESAKVLDLASMGASPTPARTRPP